MRPRAASLALLILIAPAYAGLHDNIGYTRLVEELGTQRPTGAGLQATQVESSVPGRSGGVPVAAGGRTWIPDPSARGLEGQPISVLKPPATDGFSGHATAVARLLVGTGRDQGLATGITRLQVIGLRDWIDQEQLQTLTSRPPRVDGSRLINHSWAASFDTRLRRGNDIRVLRRVDWLSERDEVINVAGVRNAPDSPNQPLLAAAHNVIVVGRSDGHHSRGTPDLGSLYPPGRSRPHLVVPLKTSSAATPVVSSAALLLAQVAAAEALSTRPVLFSNRAGVALRDAGRVEVIRAVLMASADRVTDNRNYVDIDDYRQDPVHRTDNGLDTRFGAGQLNIYRAWQLLDAGEQEAGPVPASGFDYVAAAPALTRYDFTLEHPGQLHATLSWQLLFPGTTDRFDSSAVYNDLQLSLLRISDTGAEPVAESRGQQDTTENLYVPLVPGHYRLCVESQQGGQQDYALAWQFVEQQE